MIKKFWFLLMFLATISFSGLTITTDDLVDINKKTVKLFQYKGKPTYIKFWASWCPVCNDTLKDVDEFTKKYSNKYNIITIVSGEDINKFLKWWDNKKTEYPNIKVLINDSGDLADKFRIRVVPSNVFLNSKGEFLGIVYGARTNAQLLEFLKKVERMEK